MTAVAVVCALVGVALSFVVMAWCAQRRVHTAVAMLAFFGTIALGLLPGFWLMKSEVDACHERGGVVVGSRCVDRSVVIEDVTG